MDAARDRLYLLEQGFKSPAFPGRRFYCWHCALLDGLLAAFPDKAAGLAVQRIEWARPRQDIIAVLGEAHQSLPVLILAKGATSDHVSECHNGLQFTADKDQILAALSERHGFPELFPG